MKMKPISQNDKEAFLRRIGSPEAAEALFGLYNIISGLLGGRIDDVQIFEDKAIMFFDGKREIVRINIGKRSHRVYVHPPSGALFDSGEEFAVEKINLWPSAFRKTSGKFCGMSFWISNTKHLRGAREIIARIPVDKAGD